MINLLREYLNLGTVATVAAVVGVGTALYSANQQYENGGGGGGGGGAPAPSGGNVGEADQAWQQILKQMMESYGSQAGTLSPYLQNAFGDTSNQYAALAQMMQGWGGTLGGEAGKFFGAGDELRGAGRELWDAARDPQNALRDRTQQRIVDASRAGTSARGIGMSPESAGIENQAVGNFNIDWNSQILDRMSKGLSGYSNAFNEAGRQSQAGGADLVGAQSMYAGAGRLPFDLSQLFSGAMSSGIYGPAIGIQGQIDPYIGLGQSGQQNAFSQGQTNLNNLTTGLQQFGNSPGMGWLSNFFGGGGGGGDGSGNSGSGASSWTDSSGWGGG